MGGGSCNTRVCPVRVMSMLGGGNFGEWTVHRIYRASTQGLTWSVFVGGGRGRGQGPKLTIKKAWFKVRNLFETLFYFICILKSLQ
jgi:hypothetical protein